MSSSNNSVQITQLKEWLQKSLSTKISQAERERDKLLSEISKALTSIPEYCNQLSRKAEEDMEAKRENRSQFKSAKALGRLTTIIPEMCSSVTIPSTKDSTSLRTLQREISKLGSEASRVRAEWLHYIRPFYIIDMMTFGGNIDKLRRLGEELHVYLQGRGSTLRSLEELDEKMRTLDKLQTIKDTVTRQREEVERRLNEAQRDEKSLRTEIEQIKHNQKMKEYMQVDAELRSLRGELLRVGFSRLGRPLRKLVSISERGDYPVPVEVRENLKEYIHKPFTTFLNEEDGYPQLKKILSTLSTAVESGKMALKQREAKKVNDRSEQIISGNSLSTIHLKAKELKRTYDQYLADQEIASQVLRLREVRQKGRANHTLQEDLKSELQRVSESERKASEQISNLIQEIEDFSTKLVGTQLKIQT
jgi:flagellar hook-basal body complex protein FliE